MRVKMNQNNRETHGGVKPKNSYPTTHSPISIPLKMTRAEAKFFLKESHLNRGSKTGKWQIPYLILLGENIRRYHRHFSRFVSGVG